MQRLAYFEAVSPYEKRTHLWRARVAILDRDLKTAADEFCRALGSDSRALLPGATPGEQADLIVRLRDLAGMIPEADGGLAYEKALAATGEVSGSVSALRLRAWPVNLAFADLDGAPMAGLIELLMASREVGAQIAQWEPERLVALLGKIGAEVRPMPDGINPAAGPIVTFWELRNNRYMLYVASPSGQVSQRGTLREDTGEPVSLSWGPPVAHPKGGWRVELRGDSGTVRAAVECPAPDGLPVLTTDEGLLARGNAQLRSSQITIWVPNRTAE